MRWRRFGGTEDLNDVAGEGLDGERSHCSRDGGFSCERALGVSFVSPLRWVNIVLDLCVSTEEGGGGSQEFGKVDRSVQRRR